MKHLFKTIGICCAGALMVSCGNSGYSSSSETATPVYLTEVGTRTIEEFITTTGTAKAAKNIELSSETEGAYYLQTNPKTGKPYQLGDMVEEGAVIIRLESKSVENDIAIESKKLQVEIAKKELEGQRSLLEKGGATELDVNNAENTYLNAQTSLENAEISLSKMSITAPFKGVITSLPYFTQGVNVTSGNVMVQLMDFSTMYLEAQFPESNMESLKVGQDVYVTNYNIKSDTLHAELTQLSPAIDETTRTFKGFIKIDNPEMLLRPGMFAKADIISKRQENVVAIRKDYITKRGGKQIVFTVERTNAVENVIETGVSDERWIEVVKGLSDGDKIVKSGFEWLRNRSKVKVMQ
ncbi:MAG: efflux RND transporter periplasmic adaptor subunit [Marinifilaceae bacterium]|nr:efflux RND transporter periplasmic adaptor subunit [Marinifilaceae bacterium]